MYNSQISDSGNPCRCMQQERSIIKRISLKFTTSQERIKINNLKYPDLCLWLFGISTTVRFWQIQFPTKFLLYSLPTQCQTKRASLRWTWSSFSYQWQSFFSVFFCWCLHVGNVENVSLVSYEKLWLTVTGGQSDWHSSSFPTFYFWWPWFNSNQVHDLG